MPKQARNPYGKRTLQSTGLFKYIKTLTASLAASNAFLTEWSYMREWIRQPTIPVKLHEIGIVMTKEAVQLY